MPAVIRWNPWRELEQLNREWNERAERMADNGGTRTYRLPIDAYDTDDAIVIMASVPGVDPENININLEDDVLTIEGEFAHVAPEKGHALIRERAGEGRFHRSVRLNVPVDVDKVEAVFSNGILTLTLPKAPEAKPLTIPVKKAQK